MSPRRKSFFEARANLESSSQASNLPTFLPAAHVSQQLVHGWTTYTKAGLLKETEFANRFGKSPQQLGVSPFPVPSGPGGKNTSWYPISLVPWLQGCSGVAAAYPTSSCSSPAGDVALNFGALMLQRDPQYLTETYQSLKG